MTDDFDWNQFVAISEEPEASKDASLNNEMTSSAISYSDKVEKDMSCDFSIPNELRMIGYYNQPGQKMNPEVNNVEFADELCKLLMISFSDHLSQSSPYDEISNVYGTAVFVFRDKHEKLYAFFPRGKIVRVTNVIYNKKYITKTNGILKKWFKPGLDFFSQAENIIEKDSNNKSVIFGNNRSKINRYQGEDSEYQTPSFVKEIGWHAFDRSNTLKRVVISDGMIKVGDDAFYYCENLEEVEISDTVESIGRFAFCGCHSLIKVKLPTYLKCINTTTFGECLSLKSISLPETITYIHSDAFHNCPKLKEVRLPNKLLYIGEKAFQSCSSLNMIRIPESVVKIDDKAFRYCKSLSELWISNGNIQIGDRAFLGCQIHVVHTKTEHKQRIKKQFPNANVVCDIDP